MLYANFQALFPAPAFIDFPGRDRGREAGGGERERERDRDRDRDRDRGDPRGGERGGYVPLYRQAALPPDEETKPRIERLAVVDNVLMYRGDRGLPGLYIAGVQISDDKHYFEIEITNVDLEGGGGGPVIGLCSQRWDAISMDDKKYFLHVIISCEGIQWICCQGGRARVLATTLLMGNCIKGGREVNPSDLSARLETG